ncbi:hypothetical protein ILUMI_03934, partial [Ignelater luminosus]
MNNMNSRRLLVQLPLNTSDYPVNSTASLANKSDTSTKGDISNRVELAAAASETFQTPDYSTLDPEACINTENLPLKEYTNLTTCDAANTYYNKVLTSSICFFKTQGANNCILEPNLNLDNIAVVVSEVQENQTILDGSEYLPSEFDQQEEGRIGQNKEDGRREKRKSKGQGDHLQWKRAKKDVSLQGHVYTGFRKNDLKKYKQTAPREERELRPQCKGHKQALKSPQLKFESAEVSDEERQQGVIKYKLNFADAWVELPRRPSRKTIFSHEPHTSPRQIEDTKFVHLQKLKS